MSASVEASFARGKPKRYIETEWFIQFGTEESKNETILQKRGFFSFSISIYMLIFVALAF